ncbi:THAP domain-containing protein 2-like [Astyanax mexicanus]|uniref:THAP domain-containing protein 2-like n=1 Tax=Astyanax mexicanus TaxID=7994 RepID=UPI000BBD4E1B|nr:THAP domain-containing protein 2-like [Astyanax mexicanus]
MAESKNKSFCSVPRCSNSKQKQPYLSFHSFPADNEQKKKWVRAIRRDEGTNFVIRRGSTFVCSLHFTAADYREGSSRLKAGAVPTRFQWNKFNVPPKSPSAPCPPESEAVENLSICANDHDYAARPPAGALDDALQYIEELEDRLQKTSKRSSSILGRFCVSDETI